MWWKTERKSAGLDLEVFVRETILSIFKAVQDAGTQIAADPSRSGAVVPLWGGLAHVSNHEQEIKFDVTITVGDTKHDELKPSIKVPTLAELSGKMTNKRERSDVSRVSFSVPVALPATAVEGATPRASESPRIAE